jgi:dTDP-4-amino-4,6-dideoxygalactose transaminase
VSEKVAFVDLYPQYTELKSEIDAALEHVIKTSSFIGGKIVAEFENALASSVGTTHAVGVANATSALWMTLKAVGVKPGDEVITTPLTAFPTVESILLNGATAVFADIDEETFQISPADLERKITARTKAILPVHLYGIPVNLKEIMRIAAQRNIPVVEDCAQAQGAEIEGKRVGSMGVAGCFSFFPSKNLGCWGDGGAVCTNDEKIARFVRMFSNHGRLEKYTHEIPGANERLDTLHAAVLRLKLTKLDEWNAKRRVIADFYSQELSGVEEVVTPKTYPNTVPVWHLYVIKAQRRDELANYLKGKNIGTGLHYPLPMHLQPAMGGEARRGELPVVERITSEILSLPMYPHLPLEHAKRVVEEIKNFYAGRS